MEGPLHRLLFLGTRRRRIGAGIAAFGMLLTTIVGISNAEHSDSHQTHGAPVVLARAADYNETTSFVGATLGLGGCLYAPGPISCGFAMKANSDYLHDYGSKPPNVSGWDMTVDGPIGAL